jgi:hypothetical protein
MSKPIKPGVLAATEALVHGGLLFRRMLAAMEEVAQRLPDPEEE